MSTPDRPQRHPVSPAVSRARLLTIVWLVSSVLGIVLLPMVGVARESSTLLRVSGTVGVVAFFLTTVLVLWSSVTPWTSAAVHARTEAAFVACALVSLPLVAPVAIGTWSTWAWLGAAVIGVAPLLWRFSVVLVVAGASVAASGAAALLLDGSVWRHVVITAGFGATLALVNWAPVWSWELLLRADAATAGAARLATDQERLRFAQDVHDVLGHDLTVIALKSELAARVAGSDPERAARESEEARRLAETALERVRATAAGHREVDLAADLKEVVSTLELAGVTCRLEVGDGTVTPVAAAALSTVAKEATTNVLRHSAARTCRIALTTGTGGTRLTVCNDGVTAEHSTSRGGSGITGMRTRLGLAGGTVEVERAGGTFVLRAWVPQ